MMVLSTAVKKQKSLKFFVESKRNSSKMYENKRIELAKTEQYNENSRIKKLNRTAAAT